MSKMPLPTQASDTKKEKPDSPIIISTATFFSLPVAQPEVETTPADYIDRDNLTEEALRPLCVDMTRTEMLIFIPFVLSHPKRFIKKSTLYLIREYLLKIQEDEYQLELATQLDRAIGNAETLQTFKLGKKTYTPKTLLEAISSSQRSILSWSDHSSADKRLHPALFELGYAITEQTHLLDMPDTVGSDPHKSPIASRYMRRHIGIEFDLRQLLNAMASLVMLASEGKKKALFLIAMDGVLQRLFDRLEENEKWFNEHEREYRHYYRYLYVKYELLNDFIEYCQRTNSEHWFWERPVPTSDFLEPLIQHRDELFDFLIQLTDLRIQKLWHETKDTGSRVDLKSVFGDTLAYLEKEPRFAVLRKFFKTSQWRAYQSMIANAILFLKDNQTYLKDMDFHTMIVFATHILHRKQKALQKESVNKILFASVVATIIIGAISTGLTPAAGHLAAGAVTALYVSEVVVASAHIAHGLHEFIHLLEHTDSVSNTFLDGAGMEALAESASEGSLVAKATEKEKVEQPSSPLAAAAAETPKQATLPKNLFLEKMVEAWQAYHIMPEEQRLSALASADLNGSMDTLLSFFILHRISSSHFEQEYSDWLRTQPEEGSIIMAKHSFKVTAEGIEDLPHERRFPRPR